MLVNAGSVLLNDDDKFDEYRITPEGGPMVT